MSALAHAFVRPLIGAQCVAVRDAALRVAASAEENADLDADAIHDHRVAMRRLRTLLGASKPLFKRKRLAKVLDGLRGFAQAAGAVRDEEVLAETIGALDLPKPVRERVDVWMAKRARRGRALRLAVVAQLAPPPSAGDAAATSLAEVLALADELPLRGEAMGLSARELAERGVREAEAKVVTDAARPDAERPEVLHELRIRFKRLRYTGELFSKALGSDGQARAGLEARIKTATRLQKRLGDLHDLDEAIGHVSRTRSLGAGDRMVVLHHLRTARAALMTRLGKELPAALALLVGSDAAGPVA